MSRDVLFFIIVILIVIFQISFLYDFTFFRNFLNIVLISVVLLTLFSSYQKGFIFAVTAGLLLDIYSPYNFGIITIALIVPVFLIWYLFKKLFARKTTYSLSIAMIVTTISFHLVIWLLTNIFYWFNLNNITLYLTRGYIISVSYTHLTLPTN